MKYSSWLNNRKEEADEFFITFDHINIIPDIFKDYPDKTIIILVDTDNTGKEIEKLQTFSQIGNLVCALQLSIPENAKIYKENNIKFYFIGCVNTFWELEGMINLGAEYVSIAAPLIFDVPDLKNYSDKIKLRMNPLMSYPIMKDVMNNRTGGFVRPEDLHLYEDVIYVIDFNTTNDPREETLYEIYKRQRFDFDLALLMPEQEHILNSSLPSDFGTVRFRCKQRCKARPNSCHYCESAFNFGHAVASHIDTLEEAVRKMKEKEEK